MNFDAPTLNGHRINGGTHSKTARHDDDGRDIEYERQSKADAASKVRAERRARFTSPSKLFEGEVKAPDYVLGTTFVRNSIAVVYGESGSGKTQFVMDLVMRVASGTPWRGNGVEHETAVFMALEGEQDFALRARAVAKVSGIDPAQLRLQTWTDGVNFVDQKMQDVDEFLACVSASDFGKIGVIVIDTLSEAFSDCDDAPSGPMKMFVKSIKRIRKATGALVIVIHHSGKEASRGMRGSTVLKAACDTVVVVTQEDGGIIQAEVEKQRNGPKGEVMSSRMKEFSFGKDAKGRPIATTTLEPITEDTAKAERKRKVSLTDTQEKAMAILVEEIAKAGNAGTFSRGTVNVNTWRDALHAAHLFDNYSQPSVGFSHARKALLSKGVIKIEGELVQPCLVSDQSAGTPTLGAQ